MKRTTVSRKKLRGFSPELSSIRSMLNQTIEFPAFFTTGLSMWRLMKPYFSHSETMDYNSGRPFVLYFADVDHQTFTQFGKLASSIGLVYSFYSPTVNSFFVSISLLENIEAIKSLGQTRSTFKIKEYLHVYGPDNY